ncbi:LacI family DNA-binding transcriptional regulator [Rhizobium sp. LjRoot30]|uniref:LacI family DNA-binding transcriptional regulator n=1 Tax=Rhizobium sp. LjRoot30 TaxID=3342320 RepID=UPI003ED136C6
MARAREANRSNRKATMTDVARAAGCSQATVSFVLNNAVGVKISEETRQKVIQAARALKYGEASPIERPAIDSPKSFGFVVDQMSTSPETVNALEGARQGSWEEGIVILTSQTMGIRSMEDSVIRMMGRSGVSGLIYMTIFTRQVSLPAILYELNIPVVLLNCYTDDNHFPSVVPNDFEGGRRATRELIARGRQRIATITGEPFMQASLDRLRGYRLALEEGGVVHDPSLTLEGNWSPTSGYEAARRLLARDVRPDAIFCQNDKMASGCFEAIREAGLIIGDDISVVGYDDDEICRHLRPQLSTIVLPHREMGAWAVNELRRGSMGKRGAYEPHFAPVTYVERNSL